MLLQQDYEHPVFTSATVAELQEHLKALKQESSDVENNQAYRILRTLNELSRIGKGLVFDTKYGRAAYSYHNPESCTIYVRFDGDFSTTGVSLRAIENFGFVME
jgi:hypothetical protein